MKPNKAWERYLQVPGEDGADGNAALNSVGMDASERKAEEEWFTLYHIHCISNLGTSSPFSRHTINLQTHKSYMIAIFLNGRADIWEKETVEAYTVAEAAMKTMFPRTYIFNPCTFLNRYKGGDRTRKREKILKTLRMGFFSHMVLLEDWWLYSTSRHGVEELATSWVPGCGRDKPIVITMTYEMELQGREYLSRLAQAEHQLKIKQ